MESPFTKLQRRDKRSLAMERLQEMLGMKHTADEIKAQCHNLKTIFEREQQKVFKSKKSGAGTDSVHQPLWEYYLLLEFLLECKDLDQSTSTLNAVSVYDGIAVPPHRKRQKVQDGSLQELNEVKLKVWKEVLTFMKPKDVEENDTANHSDSEFKSFFQSRGGNFDRIQ